MSARTCGWCDTVVTDDAATNCPNCGGALPLLPGADPGPPPPPAPRELPTRYRLRVLYWRNALVLIGIVFTVVFCWSVIFPIIGIPMWYFGMQRGKRKLAALERGRPTTGAASPGSRCGWSMWPRTLIRARSGPPFADRSGGGMLDHGPDASPGIQWRDSEVEPCGFPCS